MSEDQRLSRNGNDEKINKALSYFGLTTAQISTCKILYELGVASPNAIADFNNWSRGAVYKHLMVLEEIGLAKSLPSDFIVYRAVPSMDVLLNKVQLKKRNLEYVRKGMSLLEQRRFEETDVVYPLITLGLTLVEAHAYSLFVTKGPISCREARCQSSLPQISESYFRRLRKLGLIKKESEYAFGKAAKYIGIFPNQFLESRVKTLEREISEMEEGLKILQSRYNTKKK